MIPRGMAILYWSNAGSLGFKICGSLGPLFFVSHHQQNFYETSDTGSSLSVADVALDGAEMENRVPLRPTESVPNTANLDGDRQQRLCDSVNHWH
jgi:hypothetical protein